MKVLFKKTFLKDLEKLPEDIQEEVQLLVFKEIPAAQDIHQFTNLKKSRATKISTESELKLTELDLS